MVTDFSRTGDYLVGKGIVSAGTVHTELVGVIQKYWWQLDNLDQISTPFVLLGIIKKRDGKRER